VSIGPETASPVLGPANTLIWGMTPEERTFRKKTSA
jgi:hypothetical protein